MTITCPSPATLEYLKLFFQWLGCRWFCADVVSDQGCTPPSKGKRASQDDR